MNKRIGSSALALVLATGLVTAWEGYRPTPYRDVTGILTACYGHTGGVQHKTYTKAECDAFLREDVAEADAAVRGCIPREMPDPVRGALIDFAYNEGPGAKGVKDGLCVLKSGRPSTLSRRAMAGDWRGVCAGFMDWDKSSRGLQNRHKAQRDLCLQGLPQ